MFHTILAVVLAVLRAVGAWLDSANDRRLMDAGRTEAERDALEKERDNANTRKAVEAENRRLDPAAVRDGLRAWTRE